MKGVIKQLTPAWLMAPVDPYMLAVYRILYGIMMAYVMLYYHSIGFIRNMFVLPTTNLQYDYLKWLKPLPEVYMNVILGILGICALAIAAGIFFKWSCRIFALGYAYLFLLDKSIYNNHIYLFILLAILLSLTDADQYLSFRRKKKASLGVPRWQIFSLQLQIVIVYVYGGIAKLTHDWLVNCQPIKTLVNQLPADHVLSPFIKNDFGIYALNYGGLFVDLVAPILILYKPTRKWAVIVFIAFNLLNSRLFSDIGIFPYVMLASLILFYEVRELFFLRWVLPSDHPSRQIRQKKKGQVAIAENKFHAPTGAVYFLYAYFIFQLVFPFRGHFLPNQLDWTTIGNRFSWRMKVDTRQIEEMKFFIYPPGEDDPIPVDINTFINDMQILNLSMDPRSVADFAHHLKAQSALYGKTGVQVKASIKTKYNGRDAQYFVDEDIDLSQATYNPFEKIDWVYPMRK